jgi:hypothetical protein
LKPALILNSYKEFEYLSWGCGILVRIFFFFNIKDSSNKYLISNNIFLKGSGGGGSCDKALLKLKLLYNQYKEPFKIYDYESLQEG